MKKIFNYFIIIIFLSIYCISLNEYLMRKIYDWRFISIYFKPDKSFGGLYDLSNLPDYRLEIPVYSVKTAFCKKNIRNINLYVTGESFTGESFIGLGETIRMKKPLNKYNFCGVNIYKSAWRGKEIYRINIDPTKKNILIIEIVEWSMRDDFSDKSTTNYWNDINNIFMIDYGNNQKLKKKNMKDKIVKMIFNQRLINQNLEFNLFSNPIFRIIKEWKATINMDILKREGNVVISRDKKYLLYRSMIDPKLNVSPFKSISDHEINNIVKNINQIYQTYKKYGFDEIYLSIIPSPVTIIDPTMMKYNELIPRIQMNKNLKVPIIDTYNAMKKVNYQLYLNSDPHWNQRGLQLWIDIVNNEINKQ